jgi:hypothetical protein
MKINRLFLIFFCFLILLEAGIAEEKDKKQKQDSGVFSLSLVPGFILPVGEEDSEFYNIGFCTKIAADLRIPSVPPLFFTV